MRLGSMTCVDLFAGAGGFSEGARRAGCRVVWAANHWRAAVDCHVQNHPETEHSCQDLQQANWDVVPRHDLLLASPCCQGHSRARGTDRPHHDAARATAWAVVSCAEAHRPEFVVVENVPEFAQWVLYTAWTAALKALGYSLSGDIHDAADYGVPQHRRRLFVIGVRGKSPRWLRCPRRDHVPASMIIDPKAGGWSPVAEKVAATRARIAAGRADHGRRFLMAYYGNEKGGRSLDRPIGTVTTRDRYALVDGDLMRMLTAGEYRAAMGFPGSYRLPSSTTIAKRLLGNAVCPPVAEGLIRQLAA